MSSQWFGWNMPLLSGSSIFPFQADARLIQNDLIQLLLTVPGERVMRPEFGIGIPAFQFTGNTTSDVARLKRDILEGIAREDERVGLNANSVEIDVAEDNVWKVKVSVDWNRLGGKTIEVQFGLDPNTGQVIPTRVAGES